MNDAAAPARNPLEDFLLEGGLQVETRLAHAIVCRTVVQLDGDVLSWVTPQLLEQPELLEQHYAELRQRMTSLETFGSQEYQKLVTLARRVRWGTGAFGALGNVASWPALASYPALVSAVVHALLLALAYAAWHLAPRFLGRLGAKALLRHLTDSRAAAPPA